VARITQTLGPYSIPYTAGESPLVVFPCGQFSYANLTTETATTTGVLTVLGSARPNGPWAAVGSGVTITGQACTGPFSVVGIAYLGVRCSTADSGKPGTLYAFLSEGA